MADDNLDGLTGHYGHTGLKCKRCAFYREQENMRQVRRIADALERIAHATDLWAKPSATVGHDLDGDAILLAIAKAKHRRGLR